MYFVKKHIVNSYIFQNRIQHTCPDQGLAYFQVNETTPRSLIIHSIEVILVHVFHIRKDRKQ